MTSIFFRLYVSTFCVVYADSVIAVETNIPQIVRMVLAVCSTSFFFNDPATLRPPQIGVGPVIVHRLNHLHFRSRMFNLLIRDN